MVQKGKIFHLPQDLFLVGWLWLPLHADDKEEDEEEEGEEEEEEQDDE